MGILTKAALFFCLKAVIFFSSVWIIWDGWYRQKIGFMAVFIGLISAATFPVGLVTYLYWRRHRKFPAEEQLF